VVVHGNLYDFAPVFASYDNCEMMPPRPREPDLMVMVLSACNNTERREKVRAMMQQAKFTNYKFLLGKCTGSDEEHGDLVHANITDTYKTSSQKLLLGMTAMLQRWGFEWLMKVDDDALIHFTPLLEGLSRMPRMLCARNDSGGDGGGSELPLWWGGFRMGAPMTEQGNPNQVDRAAVAPYLVHGQWPMYSWGSGHVMNRAGVQQIVQAKARWMGFAEASGVWMEDVAFGMWFESLQMSCRILDKTFTQYCGGENAITVVDGLVRRADPSRNTSRSCKVPAWVEQETQALDTLGSVVCGTTAEAANADGPSGSSNGAFGQQLRELSLMYGLNLRDIEKAKLLPTTVAFPGGGQTSSISGRVGITRAFVSCGNHTGSHTAPTCGECTSTQGTVRTNCGSVHGGQTCPKALAYCNEDNGWCGNSDEHRKIWRWTTGAFDYSPNRREHIAWCDGDCMWDNGRCGEVTADAITTAAPTT